MPCMHGGVCTPISNVEYECDCPKGYYGNSCEKATYSRWLLDGLNLGGSKKQKLVLTGKLMWGLVNNIPILHDAALRYLYLTGSDLVGSDVQALHCDQHYTTLDGYYNQLCVSRGLPPVPRECPTPLGIKGPRTLPKIGKVFDLLFRRQRFKACPFGTNIMFVTFAQHLAHQFFKRSFPEGENQEATRRPPRSWVNGKLKSRIINGEEYPYYLADGMTESLPATGYDLPTSSPFTFAMATIWLREHNRVCDAILKDHPGWNDERVYQTARWIILGELLTITAGEYLQQLSQCRLRLEYKPHLVHHTSIPISSQMQYEFGLAFQWDQLLPDVFSLQGKEYNISEVAPSNNRIVFEHGLDAIVDAMSRNPAGQMSFLNSGQTSEKLMKELLAEGRRTRLHSFNDYRRFYDLKPYDSFLELVGDKKAADTLETLYGNVDAVEFVVGLFLEKQAGSVVPPTMIFLTGPVMLREILNNPVGTPGLWRPSTFGGKTGFDIVQKASLRKLFCLNMKGNCKNNVWVSFRTPFNVILSYRTQTAMNQSQL